jgi:hypothetical protein
VLITIPLSTPVPVTSRVTASIRIVMVRTERKASPVPRAAVTTEVIPAEWKEKDRPVSMGWTTTETDSLTVLTPTVPKKRPVNNK